MGAGHQPGEDIHGSKVGPESPRSGEVGGGLWIGQEMFFSLS